MNLQPCEILTPNGLTQEINNHHQKLLVFCFFSNTNLSCLNCKQVIMDDFGKGLVTKFENNVVFFYIDIDMNRIIAQQFGICNTPHFIFNRVINKKLIKLASVLGPDMNKVVETINQHLGVPLAPVQATPPIIVKDETHYYQLLDQFKNGEIIVLMFTASWCGPCKRIKEEVYHPQTGKGILQAMERLVPNKVKFLIIDVDDMDKLSAQFNVSSVPTIYLVQYQQYYDVGKFVEKHTVLSKVTSGKSQDVATHIQKYIK